MHPDELNGWLKEFYDGKIKKHFRRGGKIEVETVETLSPANMAVGKRFDFEETQGFSPNSRLLYARMLKNLNDFLKGKPFKEATEDDLRLFVQERSVGRQSHWEKKCLRRFYAWLYGCAFHGRGKGKKHTEFPKVVAWLEIGREEGKVTPEDLPTDEEVAKILRATSDKRDAAILELLCETGMRIGEMIALRVKDVSFDEKGAVLKIPNIKGLTKTGGRRNRVGRCVTTLKEWLSQHPFRSDENAPLFPRKNHCNGYLNKPKQLERAGIRSIIVTTAKRAGIKKRIYPHLIRHYVATKAARLLSDAEMRIVFGWDKKSSMPALYTSLRSEELDDKVLEVSGIKRETKPAEKEDPLKPIACAYCETSNSPSREFCVRCASPLRATDDMKIREILAKPEVRALLEALAENPEAVASVLSGGKQKVV